MSERAPLLSIVATPIGHLDDITLRAVNTLRRAELVLAEDTRRTRTLLDHHAIGTPLRSFHAHSGEGVVSRLVEQLLEGKHFALVTDAVMLGPAFTITDAELDTLVERLTAAIDAASAPA